jgi:lipopolysaccharide heptosyltransferase I
MATPVPDSSGTPPAEVERILIVRLSAMGDIIHALPAVTALRRAFPRALMGWAVEERWAELLCTLPTPRSGPRSLQRPLVEKVHTLNSKAWRADLLSPQTWEQAGAALSDLRAARYQVAVDLQGAARSALIARWSGAAEIFGSAQPRENIASMLYTRRVITHGVHVVDQALALAEAVAHRRLENPLVEFPYDEAAEKECDRRLSECGVESFVLLNPGAGWGAKRWPAERYGVVAQHLANDGMKSLINSAPGEEDLALAAEQASEGAAQPISCTLPQLIALTRRASLFIGGDTGPLHLAAALRIPVVGIYGPTNPARNGPFGTHSIVLRNLSSITSHSRRPQAEQGLLEITPQQVAGAARQLLRNTHG